MSLVVRPTGIRSVARGASSPAALLRSRVRGADLDAAAAGPGWHALSEWFSDLAETKAGRSDVTVVCAPNAPGGPPGWWQPSTGRIALDGDLLPVAPEDLDTADQDHFAGLAALHGVFAHECGHATHTSGTPADWPRELAGTMALLEEIRMEAQVVRNRPADARWLRAASTHILLDAEALAAAADSPLAAAASTATLIEGRVVSGSLREEDVAELSAILDENIPADVREGLRELWEDVVRVADGDTVALGACAKRYRELVPDEEDGQGGGGSGDVGAALAAAIAALAQEASADAQEELQGSAEGQVIVVGIEEVKDEADLNDALAAAASPDGDPGDGAAGAASGNGIRLGERPASAEERRARNELVKLLRRARFRERTVVRRASALPPGRLRPRAALVASAERAQGRMQTALPWRQTHRRQVEQPRLRAGILIDTSGSMSGAVAALASAGWVLTNAVADVEGTAMMAAFGDDVAVICDPGKPPKLVKQFEANGGTENISKALTLCDDGLQLLNGTGPRLIVVVSDGHWTPTESRLSTDWFMRLRRAGVAVIQVGIGSMPRDHGADLLCTIAEASDLPTVVGAACIKALAEAKAAA